MAKTLCEVGNLNTSVECSRAQTFTFTLGKVWFTRASAEDTRFLFSGFGLRLGSPTNSSEL